MFGNVQVSVGTRPLVLEDGPDTMHSSDEDATEEEPGDKLTGVYANGLKSPVYLSRSEVARQKAVASYAKTVGYGKWINSDAPSSTDVSSDFESSQPQSVPTSPIVPYRSESRSPFLPLSGTGVSSEAFSQSAPSSPANTRCGSRFQEDFSDFLDPDPPAQSKGRSYTHNSASTSRKGTPVNSDNEDQEELSEDQERCLAHGRRKGSKAAGTSVSVPPRSSTPVPKAASPASPVPPIKKKTDTKKGAGKKAAVTLVAEPAVSEATHPMTTRQKASRAGSLRPGVGGSGQKDACVASSHPSKT
jgi:hypothetical protein